MTMYGFLSLWFSNCGQVFWPCLLLHLRWEACVWSYEFSSVGVHGGRDGEGCVHTHIHTIMFISQVALRGNGCAELCPVCRLYCTQIQQQAGR